MGPDNPKCLQAFSLLPASQGAGATSPHWPSAVRLAQEEEGGDVHYPTAPLFLCVLCLVLRLWRLPAWGQLGLGLVSVAHCTFLEGLMLPSRTIEVTSLWWGAWRLS